MATYEYTGTTSQKAASHTNHIVALKIDPLGTPKVSILSEAVAAGDGTFTIQWADWDGRVVIGAVDDDGAIEKLQCVFHDFQTGAQVIEATQTYEELVLSDIPLAYYKLAEDTGTVAADSSGNSTDGTYNGSPVLTQTGIIPAEQDVNGAVTFDGVDDFVDVPASIATTFGSGSYTVDLWFKYTAPITGAVMLVAFNDTTTNGGGAENVFNFELDSNGKIRTSHYTGSGTATPGTNRICNQDEVYHTAAVYDSVADTMKVYVNGFEEGILVSDWGALAQFISTSNKISIGQEYDNDSQGNFFNGVIDDVAFFNKALTETEIRDKYRIGAYGTLTPTYEAVVSKTNPFLRYKMGETTGTTAGDSAGTNNGAYVGGVTLGQTPVIKEGRSVLFNGVDSYINANSVAADLAGRPLDSITTMSIWFTTTLSGQASGSNIIFSTHDSAGNNLLRLGVDPSGEIFYDGANAASVYGTGYNDGQPHRIDLVIENKTTGSGRVLGYVDGELLFDTFTAPDYTQTARVTIGMGYDSETPTDFFDGNIDEFTIYDRELYVSEMKELYSTGVQPS